MTTSGRPVFASDDWMHEQQLRAELEAEAWRRLRLELAVPEPVPAPAPVQTAPAQPQIDHHYRGSTILKALVRFMLAAFAGYLAYIAAVDGQLGEFESWMATGSVFMVALALSMFGAARRLVHFLAETMRWVLILGIGVTGAWLAFHTWT